MLLLWSGYKNQLSLHCLSLFVVPIFTVNGVPLMIWQKKINVCMQKLKDINKNAILPMHS